MKIFGLKWPVPRVSITILYWKLLNDISFLSESDFFGTKMNFIRSFCMLAHLDLVGRTKQDIDNPFFCMWNLAKNKHGARPGISYGNVLRHNRYFFCKLPVINRRQEKFGPFWIRNRRSRTKFVLDFWSINIYFWFFDSFWNLDLENFNFLRM